MATFRSTSVKAALLWALLLPGALGAEAVRTDGRRIEGSLAGSDGELAFIAGGARVAISEISIIKTGNAYQGVPLVTGIRLTDGSAVRGAVEFAESHLAVRSPRLGEMDFPLGGVAEVFLGCHIEPPPGGTPGILMQNGDFLETGGIAVSGAKVAAKSTLGEVELPLERIAALRLARVEADTAATEVLLDNGDLLRCVLRSAAPESLGVTFADHRIDIPAAAVCRVAFPARMKYLSDMAAEFSSRGFAPAGVTYAFADRGPDGPLESPFERFARGFFTRARAVVRVGLPSGVRMLYFVPQIPAGSNPPTGTFVVESDGKTIWEKTLSAGSPGEPVVLNVLATSSLVLSFDSSPPGLIGAAGIWGDAFVTLRQGE